MQSRVFADNSRSVLRVTIVLTLSLLAVQSFWPRNQVAVGAQVPLAAGVSLRAAETKPSTAAADPADGPVATGTWSAINPPPRAVTNCLQLTDGRVICQEAFSPNWYALTPDNFGSYASGTWAAIASMPAGYAPLYYSSAVLPDGRVIVMGGEYNCNPSCTAVWQKNGAIYNPATNVWTAVAGPASFGNIGDAMAIVLANGTYMQSNALSGQSALLNAATLTFTDVPGNQIDNRNNEEGWVLLPNGKLLNVDAFAADKNQTSIFDPATGQWTANGVTPLSLVDNSPHSNGTSISYELGPGILRPNGTVFWIGAVPEPTATGHTAIYNTSTNLWSAGPDIPNHDGANDAPSAVLPNGNVLAQLAPAGPTNAFGTPSRFYEIDSSNTFALTPLDWFCSANNT